MPTISVVIPSRDRPAMLREAVESVAAQTFRDFEIIVVLTGADAATKATARLLQQQHGIRLFETKPLNLATTRNNGLALASGEWVSFLDDDDIWLPSKLERQLAMARSEDADLVTTNWVRFFGAGQTEIWKPHGSPLPPGLTFRDALMLNNYVSVGSLVRRDVLRALHGFDPRLRACEDWDMWRRVSHAHRIIYLDEVLLKVRVHDRNMSANRWIMYRTSLQHLIKMHRDTPLELQSMLGPARANSLKLLGSLCYEILNEQSGGAARRAIRWVKTRARLSAKRSI
jgi:glycosyltransferase involved in cell wall biosynthesis